MTTYAGVLVFCEGRVLMVREHYPAWGGPHWNVPSGRVEDGETPAEGAVREVLEETGVVVEPAGLTLVSTVIAPASTCWNFTAVTDDDRLAPADPDGIIERAAWFEPEEAARLLAELPYDPIRVPALDYLATRRTGVTWVADAGGVRAAAGD